MYKNFDKFVSGEWAGVHFSAYTSTAYERNGFFVGSRMRLIIDQHGMQSGGLIEGRSSHNGEYEYIIGRNAVFHVKGWAEKNETKVCIWRKSHQIRSRILKRSQNNGTMMS